MRSASVRAAPFRTALDSRLAGVTHVFVDVFETCVHRCVAAPRDVFEIVRNKWESVAELRTGAIADFPALRVSAEAAARSKAGDGRAISLADIYDELSRVRQFAPAEIDRLMRLETETELQVCYADPDILELCSELVKRALPISYISDTYLGAEVVRGILEKCGYRAESLFVSSEPRARERNGKLIDFALGEAGAKNLERLLYVGPEGNVDFSHSGRFGLAAIAPPLTKQADARVAEITDTPVVGSNDRALTIIQGLLRSELLRRRSHGDTDYALMGYTAFGPAMAGWLLWLRRSVADLGAGQTLLFASRARFLEQLFKQGEYSTPAPQTDCLYVSRASLAFAELRSTDESSVLKLLRAFYGCRLEDVIERWLKPTGLAFPPLSGWEDIGRDVRIDDLTIPKIGLFLQQNHLTLLSACVAHRENAGKRVAARIPHGLVAVIDLGWDGETQAAWSRAVREILPSEEDLGLCFGLLPEARRNIGLGHRLRGWLTSPDDRGASMQALRLGGAALLELAFGADQETIASYGPHGEPGERPVNVDKARQEATAGIQRGMRQFWLDMTSHFDPNYLDRLDLRPTQWTRPLLRLITRPTREEAEWLGAVRHDGSGGAGVRPLAEKLSFAKQWSRELGRARERSIWRFGFDRRNGLL